MTRFESAALFKQFMEKVDSTRIVDPYQQELESMPIARLLRLYLELRADDPKLRRDQKRLYFLSVQSWIKVHRNTPIIELRKRERWDKFKERYTSYPHYKSGHWVNKRISYICRIVRYFHRRGWIQWLPDSGDNLPWTPRSIIVPTPEDISQLYIGMRKVHPYNTHIPKTMKYHRKEYIRRRLKGCETRAALAMQYFCGFRLSTLRDLRVGHFDNWTVQVRASKTGRRHMIPVHPVCQRVMHLYLRFRMGPRRILIPAEERTKDDNYLRIFRKGTIKNLINSYYEGADAIGMRRIKTHDVRRAGITAWARVSASYGAIIHGGNWLPNAMIPYFSESEILKKGLMRLEIPESMQARDVAKREKMDREEWSKLYDQLTREERQTLTDLIMRSIEV